MHLLSHSKQVHIDYETTLKIKIFSWQCYVLKIISKNLDTLYQIGLYMHQNEIGESHASQSKLSSSMC